MSLPGIESHGLTCVRFEPNGAWLVAAGGDQAMRNKRSVTLLELIAWNIPSGEVRWQVVKQKEERIADLALHPGGEELATKCTEKITVWSAAGKPLRELSSDFLAGPIAYSRDGSQFVAPKGNEVKIRSSQNGRTLKSVAIAKTSFTSAAAAAFLPDGRLLVAASVINNQGQKSGKLLLIDVAAEKIVKSSNTDADPDLVAIDPQGTWAAIGGEAKRRGRLLFWNLAKWRLVAEQPAHGKNIDDLSVSPDGGQLATSGGDQTIRLWDPATGKGTAKLDQHATTSSSTTGLAWSPDGKFLAFATAGKPPEGGVFLYEHSGGQWRLAACSQAAMASPAATARDPSDGEASKPTPNESVANAAKPDGEAQQWFRGYLSQDRAARPLATPQAVAAWQNKHGIQLPKAYADFVTTIGRHSFADAMGMEGYWVRIVGPNQLDAREFRRDASDDTNEEPDGLMFAVAVNGDCFCFDLRGQEGSYPVFHFDHETEAFTPFAASFEQAVKRLALRE